MTHRKKIMGNKQLIRIRLRSLALQGCVLLAMLGAYRSAFSQAGTDGRSMPAEEMRRAAFVGADRSITDDPLEECTIGAACGRAAKDGRPMIWKTRDASTGDNAIYQNTEYRYKFLAVIDAGNRQSSWMALNEKGFAILNSVAHDINEGSTGPGNGAVITLAAGTCASVAEFQRLLDSTNTTRRSTAANFVVMDSAGAAAIYETGPASYRKFAATDSIAYPKGYVLRTNFTVTGGGSVGLARFNRSSALFQGFSAGDSISPKTILRYQMRDFADPTGVPYPLPFTGSVSGAPAGYIPIDETICRLTSVSAAVIQGVRAGEAARTSTFWAILGCPATGIAVPYWPVGAPPQVSADLPKAPLNTMSNDIFTKIAGGAPWSNCINTRLLRDAAGGGLLRNIYQAEDAIFAAADTLLVRWRAGGADAPVMLKAESTYAALALNGLTAAKNALTGVNPANTAAVPTEFSLSQNFPNPFNPSTVIRFQLAAAGRVELTVVDVLGRHAATLVDNEMPAGIHTVAWDASRCAGGVYFYTLKTTLFTSTKRMLLVR